MSEKQSIDLKIEKKYQYKYYLALKLGRYFGIPKAAFLESLDKDEETIDSTILNDQFNFNYYILPTHIALEKLSLQTLWNPKKFCKSTIYEEFIANEDNYGNNFILSIHLGANENSETLMMYRLHDNLYEGIGGNVIRIKEDEMFALEPLANFLRARFPKHEEQEL